MNTLYLDMDGVVADFDEYVRRVHGFDPEITYPDEEWNKIAKNVRLFKDLKKTSYADMLVENCREFALNNNMNFYFLTAVPKGNKMHWAFYDKVNWANLHYPGIAVHFGPFSKDKAAHCIPGDILIDDRLSNISEWIEAKGIGILHKTYEKTINQLQNLQIKNIMYK